MNNNDNNIPHNGFLSRLDMLISENYTTRKDFSEAIGMKFSTINQMFSARKTMPTFVFFKAFLTRHSVEELSYLITGDHIWELNEPEAKYERKVDPYAMLNTAIDKIIEQKVVSSVVASKK
jgi:hypothetical protein